MNNLGSDKKQEIVGCSAAENTMADDSSDSEGEVETGKSFLRKISTSKQLKNKPCIKEGYLMKQTTSFQRWRRRYFKLRGRKLYYAKDAKSSIFDEVELTNFSVAECSLKNINNSLTVITPDRKLVLHSETRRDMEEWISALKSIQNREFFDPRSDHIDLLSGMHNWYASSHARPTYCNVCREALSGVTSHGLSCEICKFKAHKRCAVRAQINCKWTTLSSVGTEIIEDEEGISMPHQWLEGNLSVSAKCLVCDKTCGSVLRLQDWRCLWCKTVVHNHCRSHLPIKCSMGQCQLSTLSPIALNHVDGDGYWVASRQTCRTSPLLVFVNSKSGDNQGVKFLRRFKQLLNPAQVFDLMNSGPHIGLRLLKDFETFRVIVCGGDGSIGWVLSEMDRLDLHKKCQVGVLPLGTGNDLARVLGWGTSVDDDAQLPSIVEKLELASTKMLDRWSIMVKEFPPPGSPLPSSVKKEPQQTPEGIVTVENSVAEHLKKILQSDEHTVVISSAKVLVQTVRDFVAKVSAAYEDSDHSTEAETMKEKCGVLNEKLKSLMNTLEDESNGTPTPSSSSNYKVQVQAEVYSYKEMEKEIEDEKKSELEYGSVQVEVDTVSDEIISPSSTKVFKTRDTLMCRANSLKKAIRQIIEHTEKAVDDQNEQTKEQEAREKISINWSKDNGQSGDTIALRRKDTDTLNEQTHEGPLALTIDNRHVPPEFNIVEPSENETSYTDSEHEDGPKVEKCHPRKPGSGWTGGSSKGKIDRRKDRDSLLKSPIPSPNSRISWVSPMPPVSPGIPSGRFSAENLTNLPGLSSLVVAPGLNKGNPLISKSIAGNLGSGLVSQVLLANVDALCAVTTPVIDQDTLSVEGYSERCVMNNYFGIGLDAKITLDFHMKREEHPEKCRSRRKNMMWYGVIGGKEIVQKTYKNLEQRVHLECDGQLIPLPSLQGIVVLNIPSFAGGSNFWGSNKEDESFISPSFDDKIMEVVAVYGSIQLGVSRVVNLQRHRIAQCRVVKIKITGDEGVPIQVDGEAWIQPPGIIKIVHKNRSQMLARDRVYENKLKLWVDKQKLEKASPLSQAISEEECQLLFPFAEITATFLQILNQVSALNSTIEQEFYHLFTMASNNLHKIFPGDRIAETASHKHVLDCINCIRTLHHEITTFLASKGTNLNISEELKHKLNTALGALGIELKRVMGMEEVVPEDESDSGHYAKRNSSKSAKFRFPSMFKRPSSRKEKSSAAALVKQWGIEEVAGWLDTFGLGDYKDAFIVNDIRGTELLLLDRRDLKEIGIQKVGHIKRILEGIKELSVKHEKYTATSFHGHPPNSP